MGRGALSGESALGTGSASLRRRHPDPRRQVVKALARLGIDVQFSPSRLKALYDVFLPTSKGRGLSQLLRDERVASGRELEWLASTMRIGPDARLPWWRETWERAELESGVHAPGGLKEQERLHVLQQLSSRAGYSRLLEDVLVEALRQQVTR